MAEYGGKDMNKKYNTSQFDDGYGSPPPWNESSSAKGMNGMAYDPMDWTPKPQKGWQCPVCGTVMAPWMTHCVKCR